MKGKTISWVFSGIGVAALMIGYNFFFKDNFSSKAPINNQQVQGINAGRDVTIVQSQNTDKDPLGKPLEAATEFIGALDGRYKQTERGFNYASAKFDEGTISFLAGNCLFYGKLHQIGASWDLHLIGTDGICKFLKQMTPGDKVMRIIPVPGKMTNSGKVLEFVAQSGKFALDDFFGKYVLE